MRKYAVAAVVAWLIGDASVATQTTGDPLRISAWAVNMSNIGTGSNAPVEINIERWSTATEREHFIATFVENGSDALLREFQRTASHGRLRFPNWAGRDPQNARLGWDLRYTWQTLLPDGGQRIVVALDRYMSFWEVRNQPRTVDYPFTIIEMRVDNEGRGEGKMSVATRINFDKQKNVMELENYASEPVRLYQVHVTKQERE